MLEARRERSGPGKVSRHFGESLTTRRARVSLSSESESSSSSTAAGSGLGVRRVELEACDESGARPGFAVEVAVAVEPKSFPKSSFITTVVRPSSRLTARTGTLSTIHSSSIHARDGEVGSAKVGSWANLTWSVAV